MARVLYFALGAVALAVGVVGLFMPLLPTVPFLILAAFAFGRSHPAFEAWLLGHPRWGGPIRIWREHRAIGRRGKVAATVAFAVSAVLSVLLAPWPWSLAGPTVAIVGLSWIWTRPLPPSEI